MGRTQIELATDTLRNLLPPLEALAEMGVPLQIPAELVDSCRKIARLAEAPVGKASIQERTLAPRAGELPEPPPNGEFSPARAAELAQRFADVRHQVPPRPTVRVAVLSVVQPGEEVSAGVVVERLKNLGVTTNPDTVSNELSRWTHEGVLERPSRGKYRLILTDPTRDHEPLAAGERPSDQEGSVGDAAARTEGAAM